MKRLVAYMITAAAVVALALAVLAASGRAAGLDSGKLSARQNEVHAAAELLRELGIAEDDPAIKALQDEWQRCDMLKGARYIGEHYVTGYAIWCTDCQGPWVGMSASGAELVPGYSVAMYKDIPFGTRIYIEGMGVFEVADRGGAIGPGRIDVACLDHDECSEYTGYYDVWVIDDGSEETE